jgi:predicted aldo/keto reductase-like oxidoreductase
MHAPADMLLADNKKLRSCHIYADCGLHHGIKTHSWSMLQAMRQAMDF